MCVCVCVRVCERAHGQRESENKVHESERDCQLTDSVSIGKEMLPKEFLCADISLGTKP